MYPRGSSKCLLYIVYFTQFHSKLKEGLARRIGKPTLKTILNWAYKNWTAQKHSYSFNPLSIPLFTYRLTTFCCCFCCSFSLYCYFHIISFNTKTHNRKKIPFAACLKHCSVFVATECNWYNKNYFTAALKTRQVANRK